MAVGDSGLTITPTVVSSGSCILAYSMTGYDSSLISFDGDTGVITTSTPTAVSDVTTITIEVSN
jgi:hypothetical protein